MGFLNNTTNNIIIDSVITDAGKEAISRNDGSYTFEKFAVGDDEIDYSIIKYYGRTSGKEKIEKLTPISEAITNSAYAQKYKLISISNPNLIRLPNLSLSGDSSYDTSNGIITLGRTQQKSSTISLEQVIQGQSSIDNELIDSVFQVEMNDLFLQISQVTASSIDQSGRSTYTIPQSANKSTSGGSTLQFTISSRTISEAEFSVYGTSSNKTIISTYVKVTGLKSGSVKEFRVNINKSL
jgi:hypothetical protein